MICNVLILAASNRQSNFSSDEYPLCLVDVNGVALIERILITLRNISDPVFYCAVLTDDVRRYHLDMVFQQLINGVKIIDIPAQTKGSLCTALFCAVQMENSLPLLIVSTNEFVDVDANEILETFITRGLNAGTLTFRSIHPRYSYVRIDKKGLVEEASAQCPISNKATAGWFWYARTSEFVSAAMSLIRKEVFTKDMFFIAPTLNEIILKRQHVGVFEIPVGSYYPLKNDRQIKDYEVSPR
jgi:hypothetical protein